MMISIGDHRSQVRNFPWASGALAACCVFVFGLTSHALSGRERALALAVLQVRTLLSAYPNLDPSGGERDLVAACRRRAAAVAGGSAPRPRPVDRDIQRELDARCGEVAAAWGAHPLLRWGLVPARPAPHAWFSYAFVHASPMHLAGNMVLLLLVGSALEMLGGTALFLALYASAIAAAALGFRAVHPQLEIPLVGASGAIAALMGALLVRCWNARVAFLHLYWVGSTRTAQLHARAWTLFPVWLVGEVSSALTPASAGAGPVVAHWAHLAGFGYGVCVGLAVRLSGWERRGRPRRAPAAAATPSAQRRAQAEAARAERAGDLERAFDRLHAAAAGGAPAGRGALAEWHDTVSALWDVACRCGRAEEVADVLAARLSRAVAEADWDEALGDLARLSKPLPQLRLSAGTWIGLGCGLLHAGRLEDARAVAQLALGRPELAPFPAERGLDLARAAQRQSPSLALLIARLALRQPALADEVRAALETLCRECDAFAAPAAARAEPARRPMPE